MRKTKRAHGKTRRRRGSRRVRRTRFRRKRTSKRRMKQYGGGRNALQLHGLKVLHDTADSGTKDIAEEMKWLLYNMEHTGPAVRAQQGDTIQSIADRVKEDPDKLLELNIKHFPSRWNVITPTTELVKGIVVHVPTSDDPEDDNEDEPTYRQLREALRSKQDIPTDKFTIYKENKYKKRTDVSDSEDPIGENDTLIIAYSSIDPIARAIMDRQGGRFFAEQAARQTSSASQRQDYYQNLAAAEEEPKKIAKEEEKKRVKMVEQERARQHAEINAKARILAAAAKEEEEYRQYQRLYDEFVTLMGDRDLDPDAAAYDELVRMMEAMDLNADAGAAEEPEPPCENEEDEYGGGLYQRKRPRRYGYPFRP